MSQETKGNRIILGGGVAGLLQAYFNHDAIIISDQIGGQFSSKFQLGPKYLHVDEASKRFFKEMNVEPDIKKIKIGFYYDGALHSENTEENRKRYFEKTRSSSSEPYLSAMTANKTEFDSFDIDVDALIEILRTKINNEIILERVTKIDLKNKKISTISREIEYSNLISTIPMNVFLFLCGKPNLAKQFQAYPTTFILTDRQHSFQDFDYVYFSEQYFPFHRVTKIPKGYVFEYKGDDIHKTSFEKDRVVMKVGQLVQNDIKIDFECVKFFGRYAEWKHHIKVNDLLKEIYGQKIQSLG